jgi:hypothetical protein
LMDGMTMKAAAYGGYTTEDRPASREIYHVSNESFECLHGCDDEVTPLTNPPGQNGHLVPADQPAVNHFT